MKLEDRTVLITGGNSGIGLELAKRLIARRNTVIVTGRNEETLAEARNAVPALHAYRSDVSDSASIAALHKELTDRFPKLDTIINNAGIMRTIDLRDERPLEDVTREIGINLSGPIQMVQQFLPHLLKQPTGLIVNVTSGIAFVPFPISPIYSAAKAAMHAYTRCLRVQLAGSDVRVVELAPPLTETPIYTDDYKDKMGGTKGMPVDRLVQAAIKGIEAGRDEICPGPSNMLRIADRIAPNFTFRQMSKIR